MKKTILKILFYLPIIGATAQLSACSFDDPEPNIVKPGTGTKSLDVLGLIYEVAEEKGMYVISDLNMNGGDLYQKHTAEYVVSQYKIFVQKYYNRYGKYNSFGGWYLDNELNPLKPDEVPISTFWREVWKAAVTECKKVAPESMVTISPFFLLDKNSYRGFEYLQPIEYEQWWSKTLSETGIDILMLQDSGAEHLSFFTIEERMPFFQAFKNACDQAGCKLWLNVETGQVDAKDWAEALLMEQTNTQKWVYTPTAWLVEKLRLAVEFGENIISWGFYPYMNPTTNLSGPYPSDNTPTSVRKENYLSYKDYYNEQIQVSGSSTKPIIKGTLWWLPTDNAGYSEEDLEEEIRFQIEKQAEIGFDILWIVNAPANMQQAVDNESK
jgi:hypothetical protein